MATTEGLNADFARRLNALIAASGGKVYITSGYRSEQRQAELFAAAVRKYGSEKAARRYVAPPGKSRHNSGMAVDLGGDLAFVRANAARFGIHQPMSWEPWHWEPLGSRADADAQTTPPADGSVGPGNPDALDNLGLDDAEQKRRGTMEGQLANLVAAISDPMAITPTAVYQ